MSIPPSTIGPERVQRAAWISVTTPKLPPPPRRPQNSSGFSSLRRGDHAAVGGDHRGLEQVVAHEPEAPAPATRCRCRAPGPPRRWSTPGRRSRPGRAPGVAASTSPHVAPPCRRGPSGASGSTVTARMPRRSRHTPASTTAEPVTPWPPPYTDSGRSLSRARRDHGHDVVDRGAPGDHRRPPVDHPVEDGAGLVVAVVVGVDQGPAEAVQIESTARHRPPPLSPPTPRQPPDATPTGSVRAEARHACSGAHRTRYGETATPRVWAARNFGAPSS